MANRTSDRVAVSAMLAALAGAVILVANGLPAAGSRLPFQEILDAHNHYRQIANAPALTWNSGLAARAQQWADHLASTGRFEHGALGPDIGQNLWEGTSGAFTGSQMVAAWAEEKQWYRGGIFPNVSTTGSWQKVGHYTQLIWKDTRAVGCGVATGNGWDVLACDYSPPGNIVGRSAE